MTKLNAGLITSLPASDSGSAAALGSKRINPRPWSCLCQTWSVYPSNDDDHDDDDDEMFIDKTYCMTKNFKRLNTLFNSFTISGFLNLI